jgi:hypothetical protein
MCDCAGRNRSASAKRRNQAGHRKTMSGFQPPVLTSNGSLAGSASGTGYVVRMGHSEVLECALGKRPRGGSQAQKAHGNLWVLTRSNCGRGEVGRMRVQAREAAPRYRVGAVADEQGSMCKSTKENRWNVHSVAALPSSSRIADKRSNNKESIVCKDWHFRLQS